MWKFFIFIVRKTKLKKKALGSLEYLVNDIRPSPELCKCLLCPIIYFIIEVESLSIGICNPSVNLAFMLQVLHSLKLDCILFQMSDFFLFIYIIKI